MPCFVSPPGRTRLLVAMKNCKYTTVISSILPEDGRGWGAFCSIFRVRGKLSVLCTSTRRSTSNEVRLWLPLVAAATPLLPHRFAFSIHILPIRSVRGQTFAHAALQASASWLCGFWLSCGNASGRLGCARPPVALVLNALRHLITDAPHWIRIAT